MSDAINSAVSVAKKAAKPMTVHMGPIHSVVAGRTDHLPMHVASGSYVIPADIVSAMGEGNTMAGFKVCKDIFFGDGVEKDVPASSISNEPPVAIVAAGGEYVVGPRQVEQVGDGSLDDGHQILDLFVRDMRAKTVKTLKGLPGPKKN